MTVTYWIKLLLVVHLHKNSILKCIIIWLVSANCWCELIERSARCNLIRVYLSVLRNNSVNSFSIAHPVGFLKVILPALGMYKVLVAVRMHLCTGLTVLSTSETRVQWWLLLCTWLTVPSALQWDKSAVVAAPMHLAHRAVTSETGVQWWLLLCIWPIVLSNSETRVQRWFNVECCVLVGHRAAMLFRAREVQSIRRPNRLLI